MAFSIDLQGFDAVDAKLRALTDGFPEEVARALYAEAEIEMTEAKRRTPVDTGALRASGTVQPPNAQGARIAVTMGFGGAAAPYAVVVHENLEAFHRVGQAKFLESTLRESAPYMAERIARRIDLNRAAR